MFKNAEKLKLNIFFPFPMVPTESHVSGKCLLEIYVFSNKPTWQAARFPGVATLKQLCNLGCKHQILHTCGASLCRSARNLEVLWTWSLFPVPLHKFGSVWENPDGTVGFQMTSSLGTTSACSEQSNECPVLICFI